MRLQERDSVCALYRLPSAEIVAECARDDAFLAKPARMEKLIQTLEFLVVAEAFRTE
jgi:hypothetical protein